MKLHSIEIDNFRGVNHLNLILNQESTVLFGENGTGKSSILNAITFMYSQIINKLIQSKKNYISFSEEDISFGEHGARIATKFVINDELFTYFRKVQRKENKRTHSKEGLDSIVFNLKKIVEDKGVGAPIFVNYGVHRAVFKVPLRIRNQHDTFDELVAYENCLNPITDFKTFFEWYRNQEDIENEQIRENNSYVDIPLNSVQKAIYTFLPEITNLKIRRKPKLQMIVTKDGKTIQITQLSDGEKCLLALVGDIARRLAIANPRSKNPLKKKGVVIIDEVELHLHPKWQRYIIPNLKRTFPNIQFIISTHSPQILGELKDINIFKLTQEDGKLECQKIISMFGKDSNFILEQFMDTKKEDPGISLQLNELFNLIDDRKFEEAKVIYKALSQILTPLDPELVKADILMRRGKVKI